MKTFVTFSRVSSHFCESCVGLPTCLYTGTLNWIWKNPRSIDWTSFLCVLTLVKTGGRVSPLSPGCLSCKKGGKKIHLVLSLSWKIILWPSVSQQKQLNRWTQIPLRPRLNYSFKPKFWISFGPVSVTHVLTIFSGKIPTNLGGRAKCRTVRSSSRKCLDHMTSNPSPQTLIFPGRVNPFCGSEDVKMWRRQTKWFCRWIVVFVMCVHETSYVYSDECVKSSCFDENLVRYLHFRVFWTVSQEYRHNDGHDMLSCDFSVQTCVNTSTHP
jgi:hypothetical protein